MKPVAAALALLALLLASCSPSPTAASEQPSRPVITSLSPDAGSIGTSITISGSGFTSSGNTVTFTVLALTPGGAMPNQPSVIPNLTSSGSTIVFSILPVWRPACSYAPPGPCPIAHIPTASGSYSVTVTNAQGVSNSVTLVVR